MKRYILLMTLITYSSAHSETFNYTSINRVQDFDGIFILSNSTDSRRKLRLDCQSFFQKLDFLDNQNNLVLENFITFGECEYLYENFNKCIVTKKIKCVDTEDIFNTDCSCK